MLNVPDVNDKLCTLENSEIAREILAYLSEHPSAQDTLEGIIQWWLLERKINYQTAVIKEALQKLIRKGLIVEFRGVDARVHYRSTDPARTKKINNENSKDERRSYKAKKYNV